MGTPVHVYDILGIGARPDLKSCTAPLSHLHENFTHTNNGVQFQVQLASKHNGLYNSLSNDPTELQSMTLSLRKDSITTLTVLFPMSLPCHI